MRDGREGGRESPNKVRCGWGCGLVCEPAALLLLCCAVVCCALLCSVLLCLVPVGCYLGGILQVRFLPSVLPLPSSTPLLCPVLPCPVVPCPTAPHPIPSLEPCHGQLLHLCCCGYFTSLFAPRAVVGRAPRQPAQGSKPTPIQTPGQDAKGACATLRVRGRP